MKCYLYLFLASLLFCSCADSKKNVEPIPSLENNRTVKKTSPTKDLDSLMSESRALTIELRKLPQGSDDRIAMANNRNQLNSEIRAQIKTEQADFRKNIAAMSNDNEELKRLYDSKKALQKIISDQTQVSSKKVNQNKLKSLNQEISTIERTIGIENLRGKIRFRQKLLQEFRF